MNGLPTACGSTCRTTTERFIFILFVFTPAACCVNCYYRSLHSQFQLRWRLPRVLIIRYTVVCPRSRGSVFPYGLNTWEHSCLVRFRLFVLETSGCRVSPHLYKTEFVIPNDVATAKKINQLAEVMYSLGFVFLCSLLSLSLVSTNSSNVGKLEEVHVQGCGVI